MSGPATAPAATQSPSVRTAVELESVDCVTSGGPSIIMPVSESSLAAAPATPSTTAPVVVAVPTAASASASASTATGKRLRSDNSFTSVDDDDVQSVAVVKKRPRGRPPKSTTVVTTFPAARRGLKTVNKGMGGGKVRDVGSGDDLLKPSSHIPTPAVGTLPPPPSTSTADLKQFEALVSTSVAAQLAPLLATISSLQTELQLVKAAVAKLSTQVSDTADTLLAATTAAVAATASSATSHGFGRSDSSIHASQQPAETVHQPEATAPKYAPRSGNQSYGLRTGNIHKPQQDAVAAMYLDLNKKQQRSNNIVISGLPPSDSDNDAAFQLLQTEFGWDSERWPGASIVKCRRLGKPQLNKVQPLLVTLHSREQAEYHIHNARLLRDSVNLFLNISVSENIYINADLTPAEAKAAFELRTQRRERMPREQTSQTQIKSSAKSGTIRLVYRSRNAATGSGTYTDQLHHQVAEPDIHRLGGLTAGDGSSSGSSLAAFVTSLNSSPPVSTSQSATHTSPPSVPVTPTVTHGVLSPVVTGSCASRK